MMRLVRSRVPFWGGALLALSVAIAGCSKPQSAPGEKANTEKSDSSVAEGGKPADGVELNTHPLFEKAAKRSSMEGRWILVFFPTGRSVEVPAALIEIAKSKTSKLEVKLKQFGLTLSNPELKQAQATEKTVHLVMDLGVQPQAGQPSGPRQMRRADIVAELHDGLVRGNAQLSPVDTFLVALVPTDLDMVQDLRPQMLVEGAELQTEKREEMVTKAANFVKAHPDSPLTVGIYPFVMRSTGERHMDEAAVRAAADTYAAAAARWGQREELKARITVADSLLSTNRFPQLAIQQIDVALSKLNEETIPILKAPLDSLKETAQAFLAKEQIAKGTPEQQKKAAEILRAWDKKRPYDPTVMAEIASYDERTGQKQGALQLYAQLAVLPLLDGMLGEIAKQQKTQRPPSIETAGRLWKETHGGKTDGFATFLDQVYDQSMPKFQEKPVEPRTQNADNRVVLCELFTGAGCPPCIAADIAFAHLRKTFGPTEVIALQYHEHIPKPDPMTNDDTENRFKYYFPPPQGGGTPTFCLGGNNVIQGPGYLHQAHEIYDGVRRVIGQLLAGKTSVRIKLKAEPKGDSVAVTADAEGLFPPDEPIHLRLALAEDEVAFKASNGIRHHEMVVRAMPGGSQGVSSKDGKFHYQGTVNLKAIKQQLNDYLTGYEQAQRMTFSAKPMNLTHLHLVAFVQNDQTHEVYQATSIPFPSTAAQPGPPGKSTAAAR
jgi:hypothetical protein